MITVTVIVNDGPNRHQDSTLVNQINRIMARMYRMVMTTIMINWIGAEAGRTGFLETLFRAFLHSQLMKHAQHSSIARLLRLDISDKCHESCSDVEGKELISRRCI